MSLPFKLPLGTILLHDGRRIRFEGDLGGGILRFTDVRTAGPFQVSNPKTGELTAPDLSWVRHEHLAGRLKPELKVGRRRDVQQCDAAACAAIDPKSAWRMRWTEAANAASLTSTDEAYDCFIASKAHDTDFHHPDFGVPSASTLRRRVRERPEGAPCPSHYITQAGRQKGKSPLPEAADLLVHEFALYFWAERQATIFSAHALMAHQWHQLKQEGNEAIGAKAPTYEAMRLRVRSLETYDTVRTKFGLERAENMFGAVGNAVATTRVLERVVIDGVELEQVCVFGEDWQLPGSKMRQITLMDDFSTFIFPTKPFAGPYREEMSIQAICDAMSPPNDLSDEQLASDEFVYWCWGIFETLVPDNDRVLVPPGYVPALNQLGITVELPATYHHDAKRLLEGWHRVLKSYLRGLPGTVLSPRHPKDPRQDPVDEAELTHRQIAAIVREFIWDHNHTEKAYLNHRTPFEVFKASALAHGTTALTDPNRVRRELGKTVVNKVLTDDGVEHDGIQYRGEEVRGFLERNYRNTPAAARIEGSAKCIVSIRTFEGDVDSIDVFDPEANDFISLLSTQPGYTAGLSRWEHNEYRKMAKERREKFDTEGQRIRSRAASLKRIDTDAPKLPFRRRAKLMALVQSALVRAQSGSRADHPSFRALADHQTAVNPLRPDGVGVPPPGASVARASVPQKHVSPSRPTGYGLAPPQIRQQNDFADDDSEPFDWNALKDQTLDDADGDNAFQADQDEIGEGDDEA